VRLSVVPWFWPSVAQSVRFTSNMDQNVDRRSLCRPTVFESRSKLKVKMLK